MKTTTLTLIVIACAVAIAAPAIAQSAPQTNAAWKGQDNEFGSIRAPYSIDMDGAPVQVQAQVFLRDLYEEQDGRFYMFQFNVRNMPLTVTIDQIVRTDTNEALTCYQTLNDGEGAKCTVDLKQMPPENTEITMYGTVNANRVGSFTVGAMVLAFTATWEKIPMDSGLEAELYAGTQVNVMKATGGSHALAGAGNLIPGPGALGVVGAIGVAAVGASLLARRRRG